MTLAVETKRKFKVGTTGWTVDDLDDPKIERLWDLHAFKRTLKCLVLEDGRYEEDQGGRGPVVLKPSSCPRLIIPVAKVWG